MTKRRFAAFATGTVFGTVVLLAGVLLAADLYAHHRVERSVGVNRPGYRGPVAGRKQPGEPRVVMLGGSTVFGYDCSAVAAAVRFALARQASVVVVSQPRLLGERAERHASQQRALDGLLQRDSYGEPRLRHVDASDAVDLSSQAVTFDGLHLNRDGNIKVAATLVEPIQHLANARGRRGSMTRRQP